MFVIKRGQVSVEYLLVMGFIFAMIIPLTIIFLQQTENLNVNIALTTSSKVLKEIIDTSEQIYYKGAPSKTTIKVYFPERVKSVTISSREMSMLIQGYKQATHTVVYPSNVNISGSLDAFKGVHLIEIKSMGNYVLINESKK
ncbi:hypothetical protein GOV05_04735 [Candidatus Woesearchaeota archaeon]|nr:hypothetical protein [Candidatus Woesearchaeota archaeon]